MTTKALVCGFSNSALASAEIANVFGQTSGAGANEPDLRFYWTGADVSFSGLRAFITAGGSGTNTIDCRTNAAANGNQSASRSGTGFLEDSNAGHIDTYSTGTGWTIKATDTGTTPTYAYIAMTATFASGHYGLHATMNGTNIVYDVPDATRFIGFSGAHQADGTTSEARAQWKNRAYSSWESMFVRVGANARANDSIFRSRINGANGGMSCTFGAAVIGLVFDDDTGGGAALAAGDLINYSISLVSGVQDLSVKMVGSVALSSTNQADCIVMNTAGVARTASATASYYTMGGTGGTDATEGNVAVKTGFAGRASNLRIYSANSYTGNGTLKLMKNGSAVITLTITAGAAEGWLENTSDTADFIATDTLSFEHDEGTSGTLTQYSFGITLDDTSGDGGSAVGIGLTEGILLSKRRLAA